MELFVLVRLYTWLFKTFFTFSCPINSIIFCSISDVDECNNTTFPCGDNANCTDTDGSFRCDCLNGFQGDGFNCTGTYFI